MPRIHFTVADLAKTRLRRSIGPVADGVFALAALRRGGFPPYEKWRELVNAQLRGLDGPARLLATPRSKIRAPDDLLSLVDDSAPDVLVRQHNLSREQATVAVLAFWRVAVAPYWNRIRAHVEADLETRGRLTVRSGVEELLAMLHPRVVWEPPVLDVPGGSTRDVYLGGGGLLLTPSVFLVDRPGVLLGSVGKERNSALVFSAPPDPEYAGWLFDDPDDPAVALGALIGQTRAAALRELTEVRSTRQLAERLGISAAGASQHTAVLRQAGLISTRRQRNTALHTVTPLGMALLNGNGNPNRDHGKAS